MELENVAKMYDLHRFKGGIRPLTQFFCKHTIFFISSLGFWSALKLLIYDRKISNGVAWRLLKSKLHLKREKYTYMGGNAKAKSKEEERNLANL